MSTQDATAGWLLPHLQRPQRRFGVRLRGEPAPGGRGAVDGRRAELYAIARQLLRTEYGEHPDPAVPLHHRAKCLIAASQQEG